MNMYETSDAFTRHHDLAHLPSQGRPDLPSRVLSPIILLKPLPWSEEESKL